MVQNAKFEIEIYGDTAQFENSLKGVNTAMNQLKSEARGLKRDLKLDPTNMTAMKDLQKNLQQQLQMSKQKASELKKEIASVDKSTPEGQKKWANLQKQLKDNSIQADFLEKDIKEVDDAIQRGSWKVDLKTDDAEQKISKVKTNFNALKEIAIGAMRQIGSTIVSKVSGAMSGWIEDTKATQKAMNALRNTMDFSGIGKDFDSLSKRMGQVAKDTNANTEDTLKLASTFTGLGDSAQKAGDKVENIVKANQAFGGTGENLKGVVQAYGQMSAAGKVTAENVNQLTDNNTALGAALKKTVMEMNPALKQYGSFAGASEKGAVSIEMLDKALQKLGKAGGGSVETIDDAMASLNETIALALLPVLDAITPSVTAFINAIADKMPAVIGVIGDVVDWFLKLFKAISDNGTIGTFNTIWLNIVQIFKDVMKVIGSLLEDFGLLNKSAGDGQQSYNNIADAIDGITKAFEGSIENIRVFIQKITDSQGKVDSLKGVIVGLGTAFAVFNVAKTILPLVSGLTKVFNLVKSGTGIMGALNAVMAVNPFVLLGVAIAALVAGLVYFFGYTKTGRKMWDSFVKFLSDTMANIVKWFQDGWNKVTQTASDVVGNIKDFFSGIGQWFSDLWTGISETTQNIWNGIIEFFAPLVQGIKDVFTGIGEFFSGIWQGIVDFAMTIWDGLTAFFQMWWSGLMAIVNPFVPFFQSIWNLVTAVINLAWQIIWGLIKTVFNNIVNLWTGIVNFFKGIWDWVKNIASSAWQGISSFASSAWNEITSIWNGITGWFSSIWNSAKQIASNVWNAIANFASSVWSRVVSIWNALVGFFSGIWNSARNIVNGVFNAIGQFASSAWSRVVSAFSPLVGWFSSIFNSVRSVVSNVFNTFSSLARSAVGAITGVFGGLVRFFSGIFGTIGDIASRVLGGITDTIDRVAGAINGVAGKIKGFFGGSMVAELREVSMASAGMSMNSASAGTSNTSNVFNIQASQMDITSLARAIKREIDTGRA
ncbi:tape measure protein [Lactococcus phage PLgY-30]|uniref:Tape measure protein n=1 Tax=Lactococcus phage PLgY-30 TaxID=1983590 RepID=A0A2Z2P442_9CAUD|nr:tape measure protein [Lactococcus phage PLgY-30]